MYLECSVFVIICLNSNTAGKPLPKRVEALSQNTQVFLVQGEELGSALAKEDNPLTADGDCTAAFQVALVLRVIYSVFPDAIINPLSFKGTKFP